MRNSSHIFTLTLQYCVFFYLVTTTKAEETLDTAPCRSSDGPYCYHINGMRKPEYFPKLTGVKTMTTGLNTNMQDSFQKAFTQWTSGSKDLKSIIETFAKQSVHAREMEHGSYRVVGFQRGEDIVLEPTEWIERPSEHWNALGLVGKIKNMDDFTVSFELTSEGEKTDKCTSVTVELDKTSVSATELRKASKRSEIPHGGKWHGVYTCGNIETILELVLKKKKKSKGAVQLYGTYVFKFDNSPSSSNDVQVFTVNAEDLQNADMSENMVDQLEMLLTEFIKEVNNFNDQTSSTEPEVEVESNDIVKKARNTAENSRLDEEDIEGNHYSTDKYYEEEEEDFYEDGE